MTISLSNLAAFLWRRKWRWLLGGAFALLLVVGLLGVFAPSILAWPPVFRQLLAGVNRTVDGEVRLERLALGWTAPARAEGLALVPPDGPSVVQVASIDTNRTLWQLLWAPDDLGEVAIRQPNVQLLFDEDRNNLEAFLGWPLAQRPRSEDPLAALRHSTLSIRIDGANFASQRHDRPDPWKVDNINAAAHWKPANGDGSPTIELEPGVVFDHAEVTAAMCNDALKYVAPMLAEVATARGEISLEIHEGTLPWDQMDAMRLRGTLSLHRVEAGPGALIRSVTDALKVPPYFELARESVVAFEIRDRRVHHRDLRFGLAGVGNVTTSGTVDFDGRLDLVARIAFDFQQPPAALAPPPGAALLDPTAAASADAAAFVAQPRLPLGGAILQALGNQVIELRIVGTLSEPKVELEDVGAAALAILHEVLQNRAHARQQHGLPPTLVGDLLERWQQQAAGAPPPLMTEPIAADDLGERVEFPIPENMPQPADLTSAEEPIEGPALIAPLPMIAPGNQPAAEAAADSAPGTSPAPAPADATAEEIVGSALDWLEQVRQRRQERRNAGPVPNSPLADSPLPDAPPAAPAGAGQRPLRRGLRNLLDQMRQPTEAQPSANPPAPPPPPE